MKRLLITLVMLALGNSTVALELSEEAYGVLRSSFMYDVDYPLNVRSSGTRKSGDVGFEKIVFDSFHDGVVPGCYRYQRQARVLIRWCCCCMV